MCTWVFEHSVQYTIQCLWRVVSPHCEDICVHVWYVGSRGVPSFCASIFSVRVCWEIFWSSQNDSKSSGRYSVAQDVFRPAVAVVRPPEKARRTGSCRKCFRQTFVYHLLETQAEERIKNLWKQHPDKLWEVNESLERIEVMFPAACVACRYRSPACLPLKLCWFLSLALRGALSAPLCVVVVVIYILLCFTIFSRRALDHCPFWENRYWVPNPSSSWKKMSLSGHLWAKCGGGCGQCECEGYLTGCVMEAIQNMRVVRRARHADGALSEDAASWWTSAVIGVMLKVLKNSKTSISLQKMAVLFPPLVFWPVRLIVIHGRVPSASPLCPCLLFSDQQAFEDKPENDSVIIGFINL